VFFWRLSLWQSAFFYFIFLYISNHPGTCQQLAEITRDGEISDIPEAAHVSLSLQMAPIPSIDRILCIINTRLSCDFLAAGLRKRFHPRNLCHFENKMAY